MSGENTEYKQKKNYTLIPCDYKNWVKARGDIQLLGVEQEKKLQIMYDKKAEMQKKNDYNKIISWNLI